MWKNTQDLVGQRFNKLVVLEILSRKNSRNRYLCQCDCGNLTEVWSHHLKSGKTKSCGCLKYEYVPPNRLNLGESNKNMLYSKYKYAAKKRGYDFDLSIEEFQKLTQSNCYYCGASPSQIQNAKHQNGAYVYNGIDRIDNSLGYTADNCISCCGNCNIAKRSMTVDQFLSWIKNVYINMFGK